MRYRVLKMFLSKGKVNRDMIALLVEDPVFCGDKRRLAGFSVYVGGRILPRQENTMKILARYIIRASFSQERMTYYRETGQVAYLSKDGKEK